MKRLLLLVAVVGVALIVWLQFLKPTPQSDPLSQADKNSQSTAVTVQQDNTVPVGSPVPVTPSVNHGVMPDVVADSMVFDTKSDPSVQPVDPETDPANQSANTN